MSRAQLTSTVEQNTGGAVAPFVAGKNKIINGDLGVWARGNTFNAVTTGNYSADRLYLEFDGSGATRNITQQTFTPGSAPVSGYEGTYYAQLAQTVAGTGGSYQNFGTKLEDVRLFAGQTVTYSFWAKVTSGTLTLTPYIAQLFGTGGSSGVFTGTSAQTITTSWARYSVTVTVPSINGKTIGTNSSLFVYLGLPNNSTFTLGVWGFQFEAGSIATNFQTATGTVQSEAAACQRYYIQYDLLPNQSVSATSNGSSASIGICFPTAMRIAPSITLGNLTNANYSTSGTGITWYFNQPGVNSATKTGTVSPVVNGVTTQGFTITFSGATFSIQPTNITTTNVLGITVSAEL